MRQSSNSETAETHFSGTISSSSLRKFLPRSLSSKHKPISNPKISNLDAENTPPTDPNIQINHEQSLPSTTKQSQSKTSISQNNLKQSKFPLQSDPSVKVSANFSLFLGLFFLTLKLLSVSLKMGMSYKKFLLLIFLQYGSETGCSTDQTYE